MKKEKGGFIILSLSATLILAACSITNEETQSADSKDPIERNLNKIENKTDSERNLNVVDDQEGKGLENYALEITLDDAVIVFFEHFSNDKINLSSIELKRNEESYFYKIKGWYEDNNYEAKIHAKTSELTDDKKEKTENLQAKEALAIELAINPLKAMEVALKENDDEAYVKSWELMVQNSQMIYSIAIENGQNQLIDALEGEVL
ncbi:MAG: hypothetical protein L0I93_04910 [Atopostipes suicloacalis]|nr:hypothetical protein [Atopostipes suicloacalis]